MSPKDRLHIPWAYSLVGVTELPLTGPQHPLRREAPRWISWSGLAALSIGLSLFLTWQWWTHRETEETGAREIRVVRYSELGVPPSLARANAPSMNVAQEVAVAAPPAIAVPEPVPDELAMNRTIMTQQEIANALAPITAQDLGGAGGDSIVVDGGQRRQQSGGAMEAAPVEVLPVRLSCQPPNYPAMARQAGVGGTVLLHVLVGKDGKVKKVTFVDGPNMLKDAAIESARTAVFRPATSNGMPVEVWVAFPVAFKIRGAA